MTSPDDGSSPSIPPDRPLMIWDGDCGFCRRWIARWQRTTGDRVSYAPYQQVAHLAPEVEPKAFREAVHLVEPDGTITRGAEAVFRALAHAPGHRWPLSVYRRVPGAGPLCDAIYRWVARHRGLASRTTKLLWGESLEPPRFAIASWLFLRLLGLVYLCAFVSLSVQIVGLIGERGIQPLAQMVELAGRQLGVERYWQFPMVFWLGSSDLALELCCFAGGLLAALLLLGIAQPLVLALLWMLYLSLCTAGQVFTAYQWDILLLEAGFVAIFLAPLSLRPDTARSPGSAESSRLARWLLVWLLFRLIFSSGIVKLASGDATWRDLTALQYHYWTQPLPSWASWYVDRLPDWAHRASCAAMLFIELVAPFFYFAPRRLRHLAAAATAALMALIALSGNYGFFNLLSFALCVLLVDDAAWPRALRRLLPAGSPANDRPRPARRWPRWVLYPLGALIITLGGLKLLHALRVDTSGLPGARQLERWAAPLRTVNGYGLFAVMTTARPEIVVEGSRDGRSWKSYEFRYKPTALDRAPPMIFGHMPRLDWQMWFAALRGSPRRSRWFIVFAARLLQGEPSVLQLLERDPFGGDPPRYVRAVLYDYRFADPAERARGLWWQRQPRRIYLPAISREMLRSAR